MEVGQILLFGTAKMSCAVSNVTLPKISIIMFMALSCPLEC